MFNGKTVTVEQNGQKVTIEQEASGLIYATSDMKLKNKFGVSGFYRNVRDAAESVGLWVVPGFIGAGYMCERKK